jgi:hypothetical protein
MNLVCALLDFPTCLLLSLYYKMNLHISNIGSMGWQSGSSGSKYEALSSTPTTAKKKKIEPGASGSHL